MLAKFQILGLFMCLPLLGIFAQQSETQLNYINRFKDIAVQEMERTGIPASIKLAQGLLESAAGQSVLARRANNHFGIKCGANWKGDNIYREDDDYDANGKLIKSCFRAYKNSDASYVAHSEFLRDPRKAFRYGFLFRLDPYDYRAWANGLKQAGYATSPTYPQSLITLIERYELYRYDQPTTTIDPPSGVVVGGNNNGTTIPGTISAGGILDNNDVRYVVAAEGERLEDIARRVDISVRNLIDYNEKMRSAQQTVEEGERVYLQPKRNAYRGRTKYHTVEAGQSMFDISQEYAVKLSKLYKRNRMESGQEPAAGEKIKLRGWSKVKEAPRLRNGNEEVDLTPPAPNAPDGELEMIEPEEEDTRPEPVRPVPPPPPPVRPQQPTPGGSNPDVPIIIVDPNGQQAPPPAPAPNQPNTNTGTPPPPPPVITPTPDPAPPATGSPVYHTVVSGETLYGISRRYNITVDELKRLNGLSTNNIQVGSKLRVK